MTATDRAALSLTINIASRRTNASDPAQVAAFVALLPAVEVDMVRADLSPATVTLMAHRGLAYTIPASRYAPAVHHWTKLGKAVRAHMTA
jgi:hypothetical protein